MTIGEFALSTGISAKALRFYDERGLLTPAEVDEHNGYRRYSAGQLKTATVIRVLRAAGLSLEAVGEALAEPDRLDCLLEKHRRRLEEERDLQDRALALTATLLPALESPTEVLTREVGETHWAGVFMEVDPLGDGGDASVDLANDSVAQLCEALVAAGNPPVGPSWTGTPITVSSGRIQIAMCWPVATPAGHSISMPGHDVRQGTLPAREEAYVRVAIDDMISDPLEDLPGGPVPHPALIAFAESVEAHDSSGGGTATEIRQTALLDDEGSLEAMELAATLRELP